MTNKVSVDPRTLKDLVRQYGARVSQEDYAILHNFGIWYADKCGDSEAVLSDWTPLVELK